MSTIAIRVEGRAIVAFTAPLNPNVNERKACTALQSRRSIRTTFVVSPGTKFNVPLTPTKSPLQIVPDPAVLFPVA